MFLTWQGRVETVTEEHEDILEAIEAGNEDLAAAIAFTHVERARQPSLQLFRRDHFVSETREDPEGEDETA
jgi:DNA-binding GntR family transcriptional regulator